MKLSKISRTLKSLRLKIDTSRVGSHNRRSESPDLINLGEGLSPVASFLYHDCDDGLPLEDLEAPPDGANNESFSTERNDENNSAGQIKQAKMSRIFTRCSNNYQKPSLPSEILLEIFELASYNFVEDPMESFYRRRSVQPLLRTLALVCQTWYFVASAMLLRNVELSLSTLAPFANSVRKYPYLRPLVRSIRIDSFCYIETSSDTEDLRTVHRLCTQLSSLCFLRSLDVSLCCDRRVIDSLGLDASRLKKLTRLEIQLRYGMPCGSRLIFSSSLCLPALEELVIDVREKHDCTLSPVSSTQHWMEWPIMPQLVRFCVKNWSADHRCFGFPPDSDKLRVIEILDGNYERIAELFWRGLSRYKETLERISVTACGGMGYSRMHTVDVTLRDFPCLTELCIPLPTFAKWENIGMQLPYNVLRRLVITGIHEYRRDVVVLAEENIFQILRWKSCGTAVKNLESIHANFESPWISDLHPMVSFQRVAEQAADTGVVLRIGKSEKEPEWVEDLQKGLATAFARVHYNWRHPESPLISSIPI